MVKDKYWQYFRGICILCVILIHTLYLTDNLYINLLNITTRKIINFAVAGFIFLAGYFTKINKVDEFYKKKVVRLIPSLIIWDIIYTMVYLLSSNNVPLKQLIRDLIFSFKGDQLYYLYVLIQMFLIAPLLLKISKTKFKYFPLFISLISNLLVFISQVFFNYNVPFYRFFMFGWISYYYLGLIIRELDIKVNTIKKVCCISLVLSIVEGVGIFLLRRNLYALSVTQLAIFNVPYSLSLCALIYSNRKELKDNIINKFLIKCGDYSFGIYLSHLIFLRYIKKIYSSCLMNYYTCIIVHV